ncbi:MAG: methylornithine synthase PylB [Desulfobacterales bacterium]|jgi:methylornithine synthase
MKTTFPKLETILSKPRRNETLSHEDLVILLNLCRSDELEALFRTARDLRKQHFGHKIFLYGFLYISTFCRNNCRFCYYRRSNSQIRRYRKELPEIVAAAAHMSNSGIHLIDLTMGEDPLLFNSDGSGFDRLVELVRVVRHATGVPIMVSPGVIPEDVLPRLVKAGADWYACYQETHQGQLFDQLRPGQDFSLRLETKHKAHGIGMLIEEGLLCGVGETPFDVARSLNVMQQIDADQMRVMKFVPQPGTPMERRNPPDSLKEMKIIAVMRLVFPDRLIPASLDVDGLDGLKQRLEAGANVVTSIVPPGSGLTGVAQHFLDIEDGRRTIASVLNVLNDCALRPASKYDYLSWIKNRQNERAANSIPPAM